MDRSGAADLAAPLLPSPPSTADAISVGLAGASDLARPHHPDNPFAFLGAAPLTLPPPTPVDPFRNDTPNIEGVYEWAKIVLCLPIVAVRLVLFGLCLLVGYLATKFALAGWKDRQNSMPRWRSGIMWITRICSRCVLFCFGSMLSSLLA